MRKIVNKFYLMMSINPVSNFATLQVGIVYLTGLKFSCREKFIFLPWKLHFPAVEIYFPAVEIKRQLCPVGNFAA
jgi:hypothetical protein